MGKTIINAGSQIVNLGVKDNSIVGSLPLQDPTPQHCPKSFIFAARGAGIAFGGIAEMHSFFGKDTFDGKKSFMNHQTAFVELFGQNGNAQMVQRVYPSDIGPRANATISLEVLETELDNYKRNSDGSIVKNPLTEEPVVDDITPTVDGIKARFIYESLTTDFETGSRTRKTGTMTDGTNTSTIIPICDVPALFKGKDYDNSGFIFSMISDKNKDTNLVDKMKSLLYNLQYVRRADSKSSAVLTPNIFGGVASPFTLNGAEHPFLGKTLDIINAKQAWENTEDRRYEIIYNEFEDIYFYNENIEDVLTKIMNNEKEFISATPQAWEDNESSDTLSWFDYLSDDKDELLDNQLYLTNLFTGASSKGVRYFTVEMVSDSSDIVDPAHKLITFGNNSPIWLANGSDGTLSEVEFEKAVEIELTKYLNPNSTVQDTAINVETYFWDSGFTTKIKDIIPYFAAVRKNTAFSLSTYIDNYNRKMTAEEEYDMAIYLAIKAAAFPESEYYATKAFRGLINIGSGKARTSSYKKRLPSTYEIASKVSAYMGAANGEWKAGFDFSEGSKNIVNSMIDMSPEFIPENLKVMLWDTQVNWAQPANRREYFFPAIQTIYPYDDSVLNGFSNTAVILDLNTIADKTWRMFSGNSRDSKEVLRDRIINYYNSQTAGRYDNSVAAIVPDVVFTEEDEIRGYSWTLNVSIYANVAKTVQTVAIFAYRAE